MKQDAPLGMPGIPPEIVGLGVAIDDAMPVLMVQLSYGGTLAKKMQPSEACQFISLIAQRLAEIAAPKILPPGTKRLYVPQ